MRLKIGGLRSTDQQKGMRPSSSGDFPVRPQHFSVFSAMDTSLQRPFSLEHRDLEPPLALSSFYFSSLTLGAMAFGISLLVLNCTTADPTPVKTSLGPRIPPSAAYYVHCCTVCCTTANSASGKHEGPHLAISPSYSETAIGICSMSKQS